MSKTLFLGALCLTLAFPVYTSERSDIERLASERARRIPKWPYEKLLAGADVAAIVEPLENKPSTDVFPDDAHDHPASDFVGMDTRFRVHAVFKPKGDAPKELTVLHFAYSARVRLFRNAKFVNFIIGPLNYEKRVVKSGKTQLSDVELGPVMTFFGLKPVWLAFLKRREDGRFEPVSGQYDSALSFRELHEATFYAVP